jgi:ribosomal protein L24E
MMHVIDLIYVQKNPANIYWTKEGNELMINNLV